MTDSAFDHRAAAGVSDPALASLLEDHWEARMRRYPTWASRLGDRRFDDRLPRTDPESHEDLRAETAEFLERARAVSEDGLGDADRFTRALLIESLEISADVLAHELETWSVLPRDNPVTTIGWLPEVRPVRSAEDASALFARYRGTAASVEGEIATLRRGASAGRFANHESVRRTAEMARAEVAKPSPEWAAVSLLPEDHRDGAARIVDDTMRPALAAYAAFLEEEILPHARTGAEVGISSVAGGAAAYEALIRSFTSLPMTAEEVHRTGLEESASIRSEFKDLGERVFETRDPAEIFERLRTDPSLLFETAEQVEEKARSALAAARDAMPEWFGRLPRSDCVVKRIPDHEAPYTTVAYYRPGTADGANPGEYRVNVLAPETRPRHEAEVLAFHESIPGHHLQISIAHELTEMPAFRRYGGWTAYVEGWALYTERLADEMGLYSGDVDRLGMLSFDAWRASRLVVDTGIHAFGWTRERAIRFMEENTPLARNNIDNEVDRYVSWPGQALSYKIGQIEMWRLRREAEAALGDGFDVKAFHDRVLEAGAMPLRLLADRIREWIG